MNLSQRAGHSLTRLKSGNAGQKHFQGAGRLNSLKLSEVFMWNQYHFKKKNLILLIGQIHFLIFCLIAVLWGQKRLQKKAIPAETPVERKAQFLFPEPKNK